MGLIFTKTFISEDNFNVKKICGFQSISEPLLPDSLICKDDIEEEEEEENVEGEIVENFEQENTESEEETSNYSFSVSPLNFILSFENEEKKNLQLTRFQISKNSFIKLYNYLKVFNKKRIILFNDNYDYAKKYYNDYLNLEYPSIKKILPKNIDIYFSDWLIDFTYNNREIAVVYNENLIQLPLELQHLFTLDSNKKPIISDLIDLKEIRARFYFLLDSLLNIESVAENYEQEDNVEEEEEIIIPLKYSFNRISSISKFYQETVDLQNSNEEEDVVESMENQYSEEDEDYEKKYYKPEFIKERPVGIIDKFDEFSGGRGLMVIIILLVLVVIGLFLILGKKKKETPITKFVKPVGYMFNMPNPGYPPTGYMYPPIGYYPNYPPIYET